MRYPGGGKIRRGDFIWWNDGVCVGYVEQVLEDPEAQEAMGVDEPGILVSHLHPWRAHRQRHPQRLGTPWHGGPVFQPQATLEDDGVGKLTDREKVMFARALEHARQKASAKVHGLPYAVTAFLDQDRHEEQWVVDFLHGTEVVETVRMWFEPGTGEEA